MRKLSGFWIAALVLPACHHLFSEQPVEKTIRDIQSYLIIGDPQSACREGREAFFREPYKRELQEVFIKALAASGNEREMFQQWNQYAARYPDAHENHKILEEMAWGVIRKGSNSSSYIVRIISLLGAFFGEDAKGVDILQKAMKDPSPVVRAASLQLASHTRDCKLCDGVLEVWSYDRNWNVRLEAIKAAGKMKIREALPRFLAILSTSRYTAEEKAAAIEGVVNILENPEREDIEKLIHSDRSGLRVLASRIANHAQMIEAGELLTPLLSDTNSEVRSSALLALGCLMDPAFKTKFVSSLEDPSPKAAIIAAWGLILLNDPLGESALGQWLANSNRDTRLFAGAVCSGTGKYGTKLCREAFKGAKDPFLRMTLAVGLLAKGVMVQEALDALYEGLKREKRRWMWMEQGPFRAIAPSNVTLKEAIPNFPEVINQKTRLEVLQMLAVFKHPKALDAIREFLKEKHKELSGIASIMMLTEGDDEAVDLVKGLLKDRDQTVRVQAAIILSIWGADEEALQVMQDAYPVVERDQKIRILEAMGRVGEASSIPFLVSSMQESFQTMRIISAAALLETLYH